MKTKTFFQLSILVVFLLTMSVNIGMANIWMDESFDESSIFIQGDGKGTTVSPANATVDVFSYNALATQLGSSITQTGSKSTAKHFDGTASYELQTSETLTIGPAFQDPRNGNFVIYQFAVNVDPIPANGELAGICRFKWDTDDTTGASPDHIFYVKLVSTGTAVNIYAGENLKNTTPEALIGTLSSTSDWKYITMVMQNDTVSRSYAHAKLPSGGITQDAGVAFYCSSTTRGQFVTFGAANTGTKKALGWEITAGQNATIYIDSIYWEGGMDGDSANGAINIHAFDTGLTSAVADWNLF